MSQITHLSRNGLMVKEENYECKFTFCSDWKFAALMIDIKAANSTFFCPWCLCAKEYRSAFDVDWEEYPREWDSKNNTCFDCRDGSCITPLHDYDPLTPSLLTAPFSRDSLVLDCLHCILRTSEIIEDVLFNKADQYGISDQLERHCIENSK